MTGWATLVAGRPAERDRPAEFTVSGPVMDLIEREEAMKRRLRQDLIAADRPAALRTAGCLPGHHARPHLGAALLRGDEELARHQGQLESTRDAIRQHHTGPAGD